MKIFWALLVALILAAAAYMALKPSKAKEPELVNMPAAADARPTMNYGKPTDETAFFDPGAPAPSEKPANPATDEKPATPTNADIKPALGPTPAAAPSASPPAPSAPPAAPSANVPAPIKENQGLTKEQKAAATGGSSKTPDAPAAKNGADAAGEAPAPAAKTNTVVANAPADVKITAQDDGSVLVDEKFTLRGEGTAAHPYEITWDYLTSAEETYQPRLGKKTVPSRLTMLNDKYVKISGYVAFPIMATEPTEMLSMLNQWDGCCIGVPPTPYDAIEVKLKKPAEGEDRLASYGAITGKFKVDPYLVKDWLMSLYMMDDGEVSRK